MERKGKQTNYDPQTASSHSYNDLAGGQKNVSIGPKLKPIKLTETSFTTDATTARQVGAGASLWIYNNGSVASITTGKTSAVASLAPGVTDAAGHVGVALQPNSWNQIAVGEDSWIITSAATALVYILEDHTYIK